MRSQFNESLIDSSGNALEDIDVEVLNAHDDSTATIYDQREGGSPLANPFSTGPDGHAQFWAEPGTYKVSFSDSEIPQRVDDRTIYWEAVSGEAVGVDKGIIGDQLEDDAVTNRTREGVIRKYTYVEGLEEISGGLGEYSFTTSGDIEFTTDRFSLVSFGFLGLFKKQMSGGFSLFGSIAPSGTALNERLLSSMFGVNISIDQNQDTWLYTHSDRNSSTDSLLADPTNKRYLYKATTGTFDDITQRTAPVPERILPPGDWVASIVIGYSGSQVVQASKRLLFVSVEALDEA